VLAVIALAANVVLATVSVPVAAPILTAVAAPKALIVVAVVFSNANVVDGVVTLVVKAGDVPNTSEPLPVSSETTVIKLAEVGVAKNVATPVPSPLIPVLTGKPVTLDITPDIGVPNAGATKVLLDNVSVPAKVARVPLTNGNVIDVVAPCNNVVL
jgi:hypothetical protein